MINIVICCTPNYNKLKKITNAIYKEIALLDQFLILYHSIKKNWTNFEYKINLFCNKNKPFNSIDYSKLSELDIDIYYCEPDHTKIEFLCRKAALTTKLKKNGTHRLILDCDMIALNNLQLDLTKDWQAMFAGSVCDEKYYNYINEKYDFNLELNSYKCKKDLFINYITDTYCYTDIFPHFNAGAFLIKEDLCLKYVKSYKNAQEMAFNNELPEHIRHIGIQYARSFALMKLSDNWSPFKKGVNYIGKIYDVNKFGIDNIILFHYCGINGEKIVYKHFKNYLQF